MSYPHCCFEWAVVLAPGTSRPPLLLMTPRLIRCQNPHLSRFQTPLSCFPPAIHTVKLALCLTV